MKNSSKNVTAKRAAKRAAEAAATNAESATPPTDDAAEPPTHLSAASTTPATFNVTASSNDNDVHQPQQKKMKKKKKTVVASNSNNNDSEQHSANGAPTHNEDESADKDENNIADKVEVDNDAKDSKDAKHENGDDDNDNENENDDDDDGEDGEEGDDEVLSFIEMGIDDRILLAIINLNWSDPTPIQEAAIPLILQGRDMLAKARTGSGKTGAYAIPLLHRLLTLKKVRASRQATFALIVTPSRELCAQAYRNLQELLTFCQREISVVDLSSSSKMSLQAQRQALLVKPDVVIATPTQILNQLRSAAAAAAPLSDAGSTAAAAALAAASEYALELRQSLEMLVIDEADLLLSFGYEQDMRALVNYLPRNVQTVLLSATLNDEVSTVRHLYLHNPAVLKLKETAELPDPVQLEQYQISCADEEDKFVILYSIMKLQLIRGKSLIFVNTVNRCYKLKLFLENFGIRSCALNSELPANSRMHIIEQFNGGIYDTIIASDERFLDPALSDNNAEDKAGTKNAAKEAKTTATPSKRRKDKEYSISRGIDFRNVANVINFDFPVSTKSYIHRVGRTARGNNQGTALSLVDKFEQDLLMMVEEELKESFSYKTKGSTEAVALFKPFRFKMDEIEGFRYRARDVLRSITTIAVKEARLKEIKNELLNSERLRSYFDENPREEQMLRHDKELNVTRLDEHLRNVPDYIVPPSLRGLQFKSNKPHAKRGKQSQIRRRLTSGQLKYKKKNSDPLKNFNFAGLKKKKTTK